MRKILPGLAVAAATLAPVAAFAHAGHGDTAGFAHGFVHPLGGLDHMLAMVTIGILAYQLGGRALWLVPTTFVAVMAAAGLAGVAGLHIPYTEAGIGLSVLVLGAVVALGLRFPVAIAMGLAALFAVFHGFAHGAEMPLEGSAAAYGAGFMLATALLHLTGIGLGFAVGYLSRRGQLGYRLAGSAVALAGVALLTQVV